MTPRLLALALLALSPLPALAQQDDMVWIYGRYVQPSPLDTSLSLIYGIPETDAMQAVIQCAIGANWVYSRVDLDMDVEGLADEATASVALSVNGYAATEDGTVLRHEEGIWGVELALPLDSPLWAAMAQGGALQYGLVGRPPESLPLDGIAAPLHAYLGDCLNIGDLVPEGEAAPAGK